MSALGAVGLSGGLFSMDISEFTPGFSSVNCTGNETNLNDCVRVETNTSRRCETASVVCQGK